MDDATLWGEWVWPKSGKNYEGVEKPRADSQHCEEADVTEVQRAVKTGQLTIAADRHTVG